MKAAKFNLEIAATLQEAAALMAVDPVSSKLIAGSQSLGPMLNLRLVRPNQLIDVSALSDLRTVTNRDGRIHIGACVTHAEIEDGVHAALREHPWRKVASTIAYRSVRNRGTIGGSLAHADPAADWVLAATAMNAEVEILNLDPADDGLQLRTVPMRAFMQAAYTTILEPADIIHAIVVPSSSSQAKWGYYKFCRKVGEFAHASCAAYFEEASAAANIVIGALDGPPRFLEELAQQIAKTGWDPERTKTSREAVSDSISQAIPERDSIDQKMYATAVIRALDKAFNRGVIDG